MCSEIIYEEGESSSRTDFQDVFQRGERLDEFSSKGGECLEEIQENSEIDKEILLDKNFPISLLNPLSGKKKICKKRNILFFTKFCLLFAICFTVNSIADCLIYQSSQKIEIVDINIVLFWTQGVKYFAERLFD